MTQLPVDPPEELPIWKGRRGLVNTALCCALGLACGMGLAMSAERSTIVPACSAYAKTNGMTYTKYELGGVRRATSVDCLLKRADGRGAHVHLNELVSWLTVQWVSLAMSLEFTVPVFIILFAIGRVFLYRRAFRLAA